MITTATTQIGGATTSKLLLRPFSSLRSSLFVTPARSSCHQGVDSSRHFSSSSLDDCDGTLNHKTPYNICFVRHGQSTWNRDNRFIGWTDTPLTEEGVLEARVAGQILAKSNVMFDEAHTSMLRRSIRTVNLVLMELGQEYIPVNKNYRLNERNYGDLVGKNKKEVVRQHGVDQVKRWRRSYDEPPPPMDSDHQYWPGHDPRYQHMLHKIPASESLHCTMKRSSVYWDKVITPSLKAGKTLLVVGHENNLRSLIMRLEGIPRDDIINLSLPRAVPLAYKLDLDTMKPINMREDGSKDEATGFLNGEWLGGDDAVQKILDRDDKQVYDTTVEHNLEMGAKDNGSFKAEERERAWRAWMGEQGPGCGTNKDMGFADSANVGMCDYQQEESHQHLHEHETINGSARSRA